MALNITPYLYLASGRLRVWVSSSCCLPELRFAPPLAYIFKIICESINGKLVSNMRTDWLQTRGIIFRYVYLVVKYLFPFDVFFILLFLLYFFRVVTLRLLSLFQVSPGAVKYQITFTSKQTPSNEVNTCAHTVFTTFKIGADSPHWRLFHLFSFYNIDSWSPLHHHPSHPVWFGFHQVCFLPL